MMSQERKGKVALVAGATRGAGRGIAVELGPGQVMIRFIDQKGQPLIQEKLSVSDSSTVKGRRIIDLSVSTISGRVPLAPVLIRQSNPKQRVTFDSEIPSRFTQKRCKEIGCTTKVAREATRGRVAQPAQDGASVRLNDDQAFAKLIQTKARGRIARNK